MNIARLSHQMAMEISTIADAAKGKGYLAEALEYYRQAFELEKKAALLTSAASSSGEPTPHFVFLRGAASLAHLAGLNEEGLQLIEMGRSENPPAWMMNELEEVAQLILQSKNNHSKYSSAVLNGTLTEVNSPENIIILSDDRSNQQFYVLVPRNKLKQIVKKHWSNKVKIQARQTPHGVMVLEKISAAA